MRTSFLSSTVRGVLVRVLKREKKSILKGESVVLEGVIRRFECGCDD